MHKERETEGRGRPPRARLAIKKKRQMGLERLMSFSVGGKDGVGDGSVIDGKAGQRLNENVCE